MTREEVTQLVLAAKRRKKLKWVQLAELAGKSKEWTTAALLGQMTLSAEQAAKLGGKLDLPAEAIELLQEMPFKGSLPTTVPTDPLVYRFYEVTAVFGTTIKELIHEEFGDGIMSAIDFSLDISREADPKGDRVRVVMSGKFLPYKVF